MRREIALGLRLVVHTIEAGDLLQHEVKLRVRARINRNLEEGHEDVLEELAEGGQHALALVHAVQPWDLYNPPVVRRVEPVVDDPLGELVPFDLLAPVDGYPILGLLVFGEGEVVEELLNQGKGRQGGQAR